jgi:uncharacterized protein involved in tolerance to divalent cations
MCDNDYAIVMAVCANADEAGAIIDALLSKKLAACIQTLPITSYYTWKGKVNNESEILLLIKCRSAGFDAIHEHLFILAADGKRYRRSDCGHNHFRTNHSAPLEHVDIVGCVIIALAVITICFMWRINVAVRKKTGN